MCTCTAVLFGALGLPDGFGLVAATIPPLALFGMVALQLRAPANVRTHMRGRPLVLACVLVVVLYLVALAVSHLLVNLTDWVWWPVLTRMVVGAAVPLTVEAMARRDAAR